MEAREQYQAGKQEEGLHTRMFESNPFIEYNSDVTNYLFQF